jgi:hypothetical protein
MMSSSENGNAGPSSGSKIKNESAVALGFILGLVVFGIIVLVGFAGYTLGVESQKNDSSGFGTGRGSMMQQYNEQDGSADGYHRQRGYHEGDSMMSGRGGCMGRGQVQPVQPGLPEYPQGQPNYQGEPQAPTIPGQSGGSQDGTATPVDPQNGVGSMLSQLGVTPEDLSRLGLTENDLMMLQQQLQSQLQGMSGNQEWPTHPSRPDAMSLPNDSGMPWPGDGSMMDGIVPGTTGSLQDQL